MSDTLAPDRAQLPQSGGPQALLQPRPPQAVSFGFSQLQPADALATFDCGAMTYDPDSQTAFLHGAPAILHPAMVTNTPHRTTEDHKSWTDNDTDKSVSDDA